MTRHRSGARSPTPPGDGESLRARWQGTTLHWVAMAAATGLSAACSLTSEDLEPQTAPALSLRSDTTGAPEVRDAGRLADAGAEAGAHEMQPAASCDGSEGGPEQEASGNPAPPLETVPSEASQQVSPPAPPPEPEPSCTDGRVNGDETDVDCGGSCANRCTAGAVCAEALDCDSLRCEQLQCQSATCDDGIANQDEVDVDCGGSACSARCTEGQRCESDLDCQGDHYCSATEALCVAVSCDDGIQNGREILVDCGGGECPGCPDGAQCSEARDCRSRSCADSTCQTHACNDGAHNGAETDVDCGGDDAACSRCADGELCAEHADCMSQRCADGECVSCRDGIRNGTETGIDCGGDDPACERCPGGDSCAVDGDCQSGTCDGVACCDRSTPAGCTSCALRLSPSIDCDTPPPPFSVVPTVDPTGTDFCHAFLACLASFPDVCSTRNAPGCSGDDPTTNVCPHNSFGGNAGTGLVRADWVLRDASCQL